MSLSVPFYFSLLAWGCLSLIHHTSATNSTNIGECLWQVFSYAENVLNATLGWGENPKDIEEKGKLKV